jgi:hypothetical protein
MKNMQMTLSIAAHRRSSLKRKERQLLPMKEIAQLAAHASV